MSTRDVELTDHQDAIIDTLVRSGRYRNASEVVGDALRLVERREAEDAARVEAFRAAAQVGIDAIETGDFRQFANMDEALAHLTKATDDIFDAPNI